MVENLSFDLRSLLHAYRTGKTNPAAVIREVYRRISAYGDPAVWIYLAPRDDSLERAFALEGQDKNLPLYGIPFAIKDNLDWAGTPTTAGCPEFAYVPRRSAPVVEKLIAAGAIPIGKTNLDQFATGLVGTRTPYGICRNPFHQNYIPGGSSAGSAVAVSAGLVSFGLGTDTAGSGRVPAAFTNIVGLKPSRGYLSTTGLVPAVRSLDCVSIFSLTCAEARYLLELVGEFDPADPFARRPEPIEVPRLNELRIGVPAAAELEFWGDRSTEAVYREALARLEGLGCQIREIDFAPFRETGLLLYEGAWLAERYAAVGQFIQSYPQATLDPVVAGIIQKGAQYNAVAAFRDQYRLAELRRQTEPQWQQMDLLAVPTTGTIYSRMAVKSDPIKLNSHLGRYTNFVNLLDLSALAVPAGFQTNGLPAGITLIAPVWGEPLLLSVGTAFETQLAGTLGATKIQLSSLAPLPPLPQKEVASNLIKIAVVGAHLSGQPLNYQLTSLGGTLVRATKTKPYYRLYALTQETPPKPGLLRHEVGVAIEVEVWELPVPGFGQFVAQIPPPLGIGTVVLEDGEEVKGFLCETYALLQAPDISELGGWRAYLATLNP